MTPATVHQMAEWDQLIAANPGGANPMQTVAFGKLKAEFGWGARYYIVGKVAILALHRDIPGLGKLWYLPKGPGVKTVAQLKPILKQLTQLDGFAVKLDPELQVPAKELQKLGLILTPGNAQPNINTVLVDLSPSEDAILASFKQKTRYNIRLSAKKGLICTPVDITDEHIDIMYGLMAETQSRAGFFLRSKRYFAEFYRLHVEAGHGQLFFASYEGKVLAGVFATYAGERALYKDGGSIREHSDLQAMYGLQWEVMRWLKRHGVTSYDLDGVPPAARINDPTHHFAGLARFKTGFNPEVTEFAGTFDLVLNRARYNLWTSVGERAYRRYLMRAKGEWIY